MTHPGPIDPEATADLAERPSLLARSLGSRALQVLLAGIAIALGVIAGRGMAAAAATGGMAFISIAMIALAIIVGSGALVLAPLVARRASGGLSPVLATLLAAGALLPLGAVAGAAFGVPPPPPEPVVLEAPGQAQGDLTGGTLPHTAKPDGTATCRSEPDGTRVGSVFVEDLGELGSGTLRGSVNLAGPDNARVEIFIDGADLIDEEQPVWLGSAHVTTMNDDRSRGQVTLDGVPLAAAQSGTTWPDALDGTIDWLCDPW